MKRIFQFLILGVIVLIAVLLIRTFSFTAVVYTAITPRINTKAHPEILAKATTFETISHKPGMIDESAFIGMQTFLRHSFPLVDSLLVKESINDLSLIYYWKGSEIDLKPVILMAHADVVPVEYSSLNQWEHPPFGGETTGQYIYGRGTLDDKGSLVAILDAVENLLATGFTPKRDLYLCFGHDEEIGGSEGAEQIRDHLVANKVEAWMVLDEGGTLATGLLPGISDTVALIGISEKGYMSVELSANIPGGHSSMPDKDNALAVINRALYKLSQNPFPYRISGPLDGFIQHLGPHLPAFKKLAFANTWLLKDLIFNAYSKSGAGEALIHTTQVATIFNAGIKDNVVPYRAQAVVNYRLLPGDSPEYVLNRVRDVVNDSLVKIRVHQDFEVPASPISEVDCDQFRQVAGAILAVNQNALVSPYLVLGATDSRHFYELADHVYRFSPIPIDKTDLPRIHGVNERVGIGAYQKAVDFYATFIYSL